MKKHLIGAAAAAIACSIFAGEPAFAAIRGQAAGTSTGSTEDFRLGRQLMREIRVLAAKRKPMFPRPLLATETITYRSGRLWYTEKSWFNRQLFADRKYWSPKHMFSDTSLQRSYQIMADYGVDVCTFFGSKDFGERFFLAAERGRLTPGKPWLTPTISPLEQMEAFPGARYLKRHQASPHAFKFDGKPVLLSYISDRKKPEVLQNYAARLAAANDGKPVMVIAEISGFLGGHFPGEQFRMTGEVSARRMLAFFDYLTAYLRVSDGLDYPVYAGLPDLTLDARYYDELILPLFAAAIAQPEFNGKKFLAFQVMQGYTSYHGAQTLAADGTKTLRRYLALAKKHRVDLMIGFEWDELNENTNLEPTVNSPMAHQRIFRYWMDRLKGLSPRPTAGDDLDRPNLIASSRRQIHFGQEYELELLNIPDGSAGSYTVCAELLDQTGSVAAKSPEYRFDTTKMSDRTLVIPSEKFPRSRFLQPRLIVNYQGKRRVYTGLPPTVLRAAASNDHTWYSVPVRNLLIPLHAEVSLREKGALRAGARRVEADADLRFAEPLSAVELLQNSNEIFSYDPADEYRRADSSRRLLRLQIRRAFDGNCPTTVTLDCPEAILFDGTRADRLAAALPIGTPQTFNVGKWVSDLLISVPGNATVLRVHAEEKKLKKRRYTHTFDLAGLNAFGVTSKIFPDGLMLALGTASRPARLPLALNRPDVKFTAPVVADLPGGVLVLRAVSGPGKVWWSSAFAPGVSGAMKPVQAVSDRRGPLTFRLPADSIPDFHYDFSAADFGQILPTAAGREFYAHAGGYLSAATGYEGTIHFGFTMPVLYATPGRAPEFVRTPTGERALKFDGKNSLGLFFSNSAVPQRGGFTLTFDLRPDDTAREQILWEQCGAGRYLNGFRLSMKNGRLHLAFRRLPWLPKSKYITELKFASGVALTPGARQKVSLSYDEKQVTVAANGKSQSFPCRGVGLWMSTSAFGGRDGQRFAGLLHGVHIRHSGMPAETNESSIK